MWFVRFLAENDRPIHPEIKVALDECAERPAAVRPPGHGDGITADERQ